MEPVNFQVQHFNNGKYGPNILGVKIEHGPIKSSLSNLIMIPYGGKSSHGDFQSPSLNNIDLFCEYLNMEGEVNRGVLVPVRPIACIVLHH